MAHQLDRNVRQLWRDNVRQSGRISISPSHRTRRIMLAAGFVLAAVAMSVGMLTWLAGNPQTHFVACWVTKFRDPSITPNLPADQDRSAILKGGFFTHTVVVAMPVHSRFLIEQRLDALAETHSNENVVLYVSTYSLVDRLGRVILLGSDFDPASDSTGLPLQSVLKSLARLRARHKLLVLDIFTPCAGHRLPGTSVNVNTSLSRELAAVPDTDRLVLCSCAPGQTPLRSELIGGTVFGYYFQQALRGMADGYGDRQTTDGRVSARELAVAVRARVDRWALHNRAQHQTPVLYGSGDDFELTVGESDPSPAQVIRKARAYPTWLLGAWKLRDAWENKGYGRMAPRLFATLEANLLRIEYEWRSGSACDDLKNECETKLTDLRQQMDSVQGRAAGPGSTSLAAATPSGYVLDPKARVAVAAFVESVVAVSSSPKSAEQVTATEKQFSQFDKQTKGVADIDVALAIIESITSTASLSPQRLRALAELLRHRHINDRWIETHVLDRLASLAENRTIEVGSTNGAMRLLRITQRSEQAFCHSETLPWMSGFLQRTAQQRHDAEALFWAREYVSDAATAQAMSDAERSCDKLLAHERILVEAHRAYDQGMRFLPWYADYVADCSAAGLGDWTIAVDATSRLAQLLETSVAAKMSESGLSKRQLEAIQQATEDVCDALDAVATPFTSASVTHLLECCKNQATGTKAITEFDTLLATPLVAAADRKALWLGRMQIARRLHEETVRRDQEEERQGRQTSLVPDVDADSAARVQTRNAVRKALVARDLIRLSGLKIAQNQPAIQFGEDEGLLPVQLAQISHLWNVTLPHALESSKSLKIQDRLSRIYPPLKPIRLLDEQETNPTVRLLTERRDRLWQWLASRYHYETLDGPDAEFYARLAVEFVAYIGDQEVPSLRVDGPISPQGDKLPISCVVSWGTSNTPKNAARVGVRIINPAAPWLRIERIITAGAEGRQSPLALSLTTSQDFTRPVRPPLGFMVIWDIAGWSFHRVVAVPALADQNSLTVMLSPNAKQPVPSLTEVAVRSNIQPCPLYLYVKNHDPKPHKVIVQLNSTGHSTAPVTIPPGQCVAVKMPAASPLQKTASKSELHATGQQKNGVSFHGPLRVTLVDADKQNVLATATFPVALIEPRQLIDIVSTRFVPLSTTHNRLEVAVRQRGNLPGPPCRVQLDVLPDHVPGLHGMAGGNLQGVVPPDGRSLGLFAKDLQLTPGDAEQGQFSLSVDGMPRSAVFNTTFSRGGDPTTPVEAIRPVLRMTAPPAARSGGKFAVHIETNYAPTDARLTVRLGRRLLSGRIVVDREVELPDARCRKIEMAIDGKSGALMFAGQITDWDLPLDTAGIVGYRMLEVNLATHNGQSIATVSQQVAFGDQPPQGVRFVQMPTEAWNQKPITLVAVADHSVPEISKVVFFVGQPAGNAPPKTVVPVAGVPADSTRRMWTASLPLKASMQGKIFVSVQFVNAAGLSTCATADIRLVNNEITGARIHGKVMEGTIPQAGIGVALKGANGSQTGTTATAADGSFSFENLKPGKYLLDAAKPISGRTGTATVEVMPNSTTETTIELWL